MASSDSSNARPSGATWIAGIVLLLVAAASSFLLVMYSWNAMELAGCGEGPDGAASACEALAKSAWGKVPGLGWPVSHVGFAYFLGAMLAWVLSRGDLPSLVRWLVRFGGLVSVMYIGVMLAKGTVCPYCLSSHICNILFVGIVEFLAVRPAGAAAPAMGRAVGAAAGLGLVALVSLLVVDGRVQAKIDDEATAQNEGAVPEMVAPKVAPLAEQIEYFMPAGFTGRYRMGPEAAVARIVIVSDYQCPDCAKMEAQVRTIMETHDNVSVSAKHFPFCIDCNPRASRNLHPNACWAARAAEAAGRLQGDEGFWRMHEWLFDREGHFTDRELSQALPGLGFEPGPFLEMMASQEVLDLVQEDIEEAVELGMFFTPMVFVNGVELKGWRAPDSLIRTVNQVIAANPAPANAVADQPLNAVGKYIVDWWRPRGRTNMPPAQDGQWKMGAVDVAAPTEIRVWGDLQEPHTARLDRIVRKVLEATPGVRYTFRHYPFDSSCNDNMQDARHPNACAAARATEAAGQLSGDNAFASMQKAIQGNKKPLTAEIAADLAADLGMDRDAYLAMFNSSQVAAAPGVIGATPEKVVEAKALEAARLLRGQLAYWKMHEAIMSNQDMFTPSGAADFAVTLGMNRDAFITKMASSEVNAAVQADIAAAKRLGLRGIPFVFFGNRAPPRWYLKGETDEDEELIPRMMMEISAGLREPPPIP